MSFVLEYERAIHLDAEALAEGGIAEAYRRLLPELQAFVANPDQIEEQRDDDAPSYSVRSGDLQFKIYAPELDKLSDSWGRATVALFSIVNEQLGNSTHRFYAINGGSDLFGILLTPEEATALQESLSEKLDWPYIPRNEYPWYGKHH